MAKTVDANSRRVPVTFTLPLWLVEQLDEIIAKTPGMNRGRLAEEALCKTHWLTKPNSVEPGSW